MVNFRNVLLIYDRGWFRIHVVYHKTEKLATKFKYIAIDIMVYTSGLQKKFKCWKEHYIFTHH